MEQNACWTAMNSNSASVSADDLRQIISDGNQTRLDYASSIYVDNGDKATFKALTGALKYALVQLCLIPTGDDVEKDSPTAPARQNSRRQKKQTSTTLELIKAEMGKTGCTYELLCKYCELKDRPKPADMDESQQRKLLAFIKTEKGIAAVMDVELV